MPYKLLPDIAIADIAFEATGKDLSTLFGSTAQAYIDLSVDPKTVQPNEERKITLQSDAVDKLLFDFLGELIFIKDADFLIFASCAVTVSEREGKYDLQATLNCESIKPEKHKLKMDVKAVTQHMFVVEHSDNGWRAVVVLDI